MSNKMDAKSAQISKNRDEAEGHRDEYSQRLHKTHDKVEQELSKAAESNDPTTLHHASKGVMKREKVQSETPEADEDDVKDRVDAEDNYNKAEESTQRAKEEQHKEAAHTIQAERQKDLALKKAAAVFDNYVKNTHSTHHTDNDKEGSGRLTEVKEGVKDRAEGVKDKVNEWKAEAMEKGEEMKDSAVHQYHAAINTASEWKDAAVQKGREVKESVTGHLHSAKEKVEGTDVREKAEELSTEVGQKKDQVKQQVNERSEQVKEKVEEVSDKARANYQSAAQVVKDEVAHLQQVAASTLSSVQNSAVHNANIIATQANKAKDGIINAVSHEAEQVKETVSGWTGAVSEKIDEYRDEGRHEREEWRKDDGDDHQSITEKVSSMWQREVSGGRDEGRSVESSPIDDSTSSSSVADLSSSAVPELGHRVPSLYSSFDGLRGEDEGMGDGARLAAMVQDMSEY